MSDSCLNCGGLIMEHGKAYGYSGHVCDCPISPKYQYQRRALKEEIKGKLITLTKEQLDIITTLQQDISILSVTLDNILKIQGASLEKVKDWAAQALQKVKKCT